MHHLHFHVVLQSQCDFLDDHLLAEYRYTVEDEADDEEDQDDNVERYIDLLVFKSLKKMYEQVVFAV